MKQHTYIYYKYIYNQNESSHASPLKQEAHRSKSILNRRLLPSILLHRRGFSKRRRRPRNPHRLHRRRRRRLQRLLLRSRRRHRQGRVSHLQDRHVQGLWLVRLQRILNSSRIWRCHSWWRWCALNLTRRFIGFLQPWLRQRSDRYWIVPCGGEECDRSLLRWEWWAVAGECCQCGSLDLDCRSHHYWSEVWVRYRARPEQACHQGICVIL